MFTGIIEKTLPIIAASDGPMFRRLVLPNPWPDVQLGESIAVNGVCLTVAEMNATSLSFDVIAETLAKTNLSLLKPGSLVHVERALRLGDRLSGHFVQGHVDGTGSITNVTATADEFRLTVELPAPLAKYLVPKGSVTLDGVSLTIAAIHPDKTFDVALIPTTLTITALGKRPAGYPINVEMDTLTKTIISQLELMNLSPAR